jgi:hypothetical protein
MDDFNVSSLHESKNEWGARLLTILTPLIIEGLKSIFEEAFKLCKDNNETDKYLMTFQNFLSRIPKWNSAVIEQEKKRIVDKSACSYLEDLVTCVHIIQLKLLTAMRVGHKQKKIDINIPKLDDFIHKAYISVARKVYKNVYLFELGIPPLQVQKHNRELEVIVQECILNTVRENIPIESILKAYMDETVEEDIVEEIKEQIVEEPGKQPSGESQIVSESSNNASATITASNENITSTNNNTGIKFNDIDMVRDFKGREEMVEAPKTIERLEEISNLRNIQRKLEEQEDDDEDNVKLNIMDQDVPLTNLDVHDINPPDINLNIDDLLTDIEILT